MNRESTPHVIANVILRIFQDCLRDIELAFQKGYPEDRSYKLYMRKGHCLSKLGRIKAALQAFRLALHALENARDMPKEKHSKLN